MPSIVIVIRCFLYVGCIAELDDDDEELVAPPTKSHSISETWVLFIVELTILFYIGNRYIVVKEENFPT